MHARTSFSPTASKAEATRNRGRRNYSFESQAQNKVFQKDNFSVPNGTDLTRPPTNFVIPAKAGIQFLLGDLKLDPSLRWDDGFSQCHSPTSSFPEIQTDNSSVPFSPRFKRIIPPSLFPAPNTSDRLREVSVETPSSGRADWISGFRIQQKVSSRPAAFKVMACSPHLQGADPAFPVRHWHRRCRV